MNNLLYKLLPLALSLLLSQIIYMKVDNKYEITKKISAKIPVGDKWKPLFCIVSAVVIIVIIGGIGVYVISIPVTVYCIFSGIIAGISAGISNKITIENKK